MDPSVNEGTTLHVSHLTSCDSAEDTLMKSVAFFAFHGGIHRR
jgi:hypothetical protein